MSGFRRFINTLAELFSGKQTTQANNDALCIVCHSPQIKKVGEKIHCAACGYVSVYDPIGIAEEDVIALNKWES